MWCLGNLLANDHNRLSIFQASIVKLWLRGGKIEGWGRGGGGWDVQSRGRTELSLLSPPLTSTDTCCALIWWEWVRWGKKKKKKKDGGKPAWFPFVQHLNNSLPRGHTRWLRLLQRKGLPRVESLLPYPLVFLRPTFPTGVTCCVSGRTGARVCRKFSTFCLFFTIFLTNSQTTLYCLRISWDMLKWARLEVEMKVDK